MQIVKFDWNRYEGSIRDARKLTFILLVIAMQQNLFASCRQPIGDAILRMFPYVSILIIQSMSPVIPVSFHQFCEIESLTASDPILKSSLASSRMQLAMAYLNEQHLDTLIEQLEQVRLLEIDRSNRCLISLFPFRCASVRNGMHAKSLWNSSKVWSSAICSMHVPMPTGCINSSSLVSSTRDWKFEQQHRSPCLASTNVVTFKRSITTW